MQNKPCIIYGSDCLTSIFSSYKVKSSADPPPPLQHPKFTGDHLMNILQFALIDLYSFIMLFMPNVHGITIRY
jgi:hypothetical protein